MAEVNGVWRVLLVPVHVVPRMQAAAEGECYEYRKGHQDAMAIMHQVAHNVIEGFIEALLAGAQPMEHLNFTQLCGELNNPELRKQHLGRVTFVRRVEKQLLEELCEMAAEISGVTISVMHWAQDEHKVVETPLAEFLAAVC